MGDASLQLSPSTTRELLDMAQEYLFYYHGVAIMDEAITEVAGR
jgi:hypothetical protein